MGRGIWHSVCMSNFDDLLGNFDSRSSQPRKKKRRREVHPQNPSNLAISEEKSPPSLEPSSHLPSSAPQVEENVFDFDRCSSASTFPAISIPITDIVLLCKAKDESLLLPSFLEHYKKLGVDSVLMLDNNSKDGTRELAKKLCGELGLKLFIFVSRGGEGKGRGGGVGVTRSIGCHRLH